MTRILVIEDQQDLRHDITEMLTIEGFEVHEAENGARGVDVALAILPDVIVCDIMMPELDGYGVLQTIRKYEQLALVPFIFLTAKTDRINMRHGMVLGADDYLTKPFMVNEILSSIQTQLAKRQQFNTVLDTRLANLSQNIITALPHELRTPLNTILGFSEMLNMEAQHIQPAQIADWSQHINIAAQQLYRLVENYLYYVQIQLTANQPHTQEEIAKARLADAHIIAEHQIERNMRQYGRLKDLYINLIPAPILNIAQPAFLKILDEILDNANKFSHLGTTISVMTRLVDENTTHPRYELCIHDQGRGISREQIEHIGAYMQFDRLLYEQQGTGMGLAIVKQLTDLYHTIFTIANEQNGTRVCVQFPIVL